MITSQILGIASGGLGLDCQDVAVMHAGVFWLRGPPNVLGSLFRGSGQNLTLRQSPEIRGNFLKICVKIIKNMKVFEKNSENMQNFTEYLVPFGCVVGKIRIIIYIAIMVIPKLREFSIILSINWTIKL